MLWSILCTRLMAQLGPVWSRHCEICFPDGRILTVDFFFQHGQKPGDILHRLLREKSNIHSNSCWRIKNKLLSKPTASVYRPTTRWKVQTQMFLNLDTFTRKPGTVSAHLGKCVRMRVRFSGNSLSFSTLNFSRSCRRVTMKMDLSKLRPNTWVVS